MSIIVSKLSNEMTVATDHMPGVETATLGVWVGFGTRHETAPQNGVAHLLEHMAFRETRNRTTREITSQIESVGGMVNAYTSREATAYCAQMLAEDVPLAVDILSDIVQNALLKEDELNIERDIILQELGEANYIPDDVIFDRFQETAYPDQGLGRPILGREDIIKNIERDSIAGLMRDHYTGPSMNLIAAGAVDNAKIFEQANEQFSGLPSHQAQECLPATYHGGFVSDVREIEQTHVILGYEGVSAADPDYYALALFSNMLGGGMSSKLFQEIREKRGLAYSVYSFFSAYGDAGLFGVYAGTDETKAKEVLTVAKDNIMELLDELNEENVERAKRQIKAAVLMGRESSMNRCEQLAQQIMLFGRPLSSAELRHEIDSVTVEQMRDIAMRTIATNPTLAVMGGKPSVEALEGFIG